MQSQINWLTNYKTIRRHSLNGNPHTNTHTKKVNTTAKDAPRHFNNAVKTLFGMRFIVVVDAENTLTNGHLTEADYFAMEYCV